ncbi:MAG TPA: hypothetical protein VNT81_08035 [Vicinamibacterales bacterium]|nr:hypothetical protein [Vicinamibacterales bacterium]
MRLALATIWILFGFAIAGGLYWAFLITPVSTALALGATALLALAVLALLGVTFNGAIEIWSRGFSLAGMRRSLGSIGSVVPAGLIVFVLWWLSSRVELSAAQNSGQINAWFIARFGWDDVSWLFTAIRYAAMWFTWVLGTLLAFSLMSAILHSGWEEAGKPSWLGRAVRPRALLVATLALVFLVALPWAYLVPWRPEGLPASSVELAFIVTKLSVAGIAAAIALALIAREAAPSSAPLPAQPLIPDP